SVRMKIAVRILPVSTGNAPVTLLLPAGAGTDAGERLGQGHGRCPLARDDILIRDLGLALARPCLV
ncbi:MAG: hypothetical protein WCD66_11365, partial [Rhodanobacteraceae bacterium]